MNQGHQTGRIIRMNELVHKIGYAKSTIYGLVKDGRFPAPFKLVPNGRAMGWFEDSVNQWLKEQANNSKADE